MVAPWWEIVVVAVKTVRGKLRAIWWPVNRDVMYVPDRWNERTVLAVAALICASRAVWKSRQITL